MFINDTHLPQLLTPTEYTSAEQLQREMQAIFEPSWHCIGSAGDLPKQGDFKTFELLGRPLYIRHGENGLAAYLNVCSHRFAKLTNAPCGHAESIRCQYHGWEYADDGHTRKIPDAPSFKPMEKGQLGLTTFRLEMAGQLAFVTLNPDAPPLKDHLQEHFALAEEIYGPGRVQTFATERIVEANWKVFLENAVESYHIDMVHPKTFRHFPPAEECTHEFADGWTSFSVPNARFWLEILMHRLAGIEPRLRYTHTLIYPNVAFARTGLFSVMECIYPLGVDRCRIISRGFLDQGSAGTVQRWILKQVWGKPGSKFLALVNAEDAAIMPHIQTGLRSPLHPGTGLISRREERVWHFQKFVQERTLASSSVEA